MAATLRPQAPALLVCRVLTSLRLSSAHWAVPPASSRGMIMSPLSSSRFNGQAPGYRGAPRAAADPPAAAPSMSELPPKPARMKSLYCRMCGKPMEWGVPAGEKQWRHTCANCRYVDYYNPKMVVGCIVEHAGKILMCRRAIEPCRGLWTLPAGYMELDESSADGAMRETMEEANAAVEILGPYAHFDIPRIGQAYILFRAVLAAPYTFSPGEESLEAVLMRPQDIPLSEVAFSSISIALELYQQDLQAGRFHVHHGVIDKKQGSGPNDPDSFALTDHFAIATTVRASQQESHL